MSLTRDPSPGRIHSIRRAGSKLVFIDVVSEFDRVQGLVNLGRLRGVSVEQFKDLARLLRRGDHIRMSLLKLLEVAPFDVTTLKGSYDSYDSYEMAMILL